MIVLFALLSVPAQIENIGTLTNPVTSRD